MVNGTGDQNRCILMVDDDEDDVGLFRMALERKGTDVELHAFNESSAFTDWLSRHPRGEFLNFKGDVVSLLVIDINLPLVSGLTLVAKLRDYLGGVCPPIIVFSTSESPDDINRSYKNGACSFITKPTDFSGWRHVAEIVGEYWLNTVRLPQPD